MKKGQAALEFLTTYGWALMVVLVMVGAMAYYGVIRPHSLLPDKCLFGAGIGCSDYAAFSDDYGGANANTIQAQLLNSFGYTVTIMAVEVDCSGLTSDCTQCSEAGNEWCGLINDGTTWKSDKNKSLIISAPLINDGDKPKADVIITYRKSGSVYDKKISGQISSNPS